MAPHNHSGWSDDDRDLHATTIRFTPDRWAQLEHDASRDGVSVAQAVRDAVRFRLAYSAGRRDTWS